MWYFWLLFASLAECSWNKDTGSSNSLNLLFSAVTEELGLDNDGLLGQMALAKHLVITLQRNTTYKSHQFGIIPHHMAIPMEEKPKKHTFLVPRGSYNYRTLQRPLNESSILKTESLCQDWVLPLVHGALELRLCRKCVFFTLIIICEWVT